MIDDRGGERRRRCTRHGAGAIPASYLILAIYLPQGVWTWSESSSAPAPSANLSLRLQCYPMQLAVYRAVMAKKGYM